MHTQYGYDIRQTLFSEASLYNFRKVNGKKRNT